MTNLAASPESSFTGAAQPNRSQLERALLAALAGGPGKLIEQVHYVLALSHQVKPSLPSSNEAVQSLNVAEARSIALTQLAEHLSEVELIELYQELQKIETPEVRLLNMAKLALLLPPQYFQTIVRVVWAQASEISHPDAQARVLFQLTPLLTLVHDEPVAPPILLEVVALAQAVGNIEARIRSLMALIPYLPHSMRVRVLHRVIDEIDRLHNDAQRSAALSGLAVQMLPEIETRTLRSAESIQVPAERARAFTALARHLPLALQPGLRRSALNAIASIAEEEDRASALIAFAPHLEYVTDTEHFPHVLEQALGIAISIKRRHLRARVLVALAPHLTLDLQGEALAAVHGISSERERAMLLAQLAPTLPPNMVVASLAVAHSMEEHDARVHALTVLAHYVPEHARERTMLDALAAASNMPHRLERVNTLMGLIDVLPAHLQTRAAADALEAARQIENESARARALSLIAPNLPQSLHKQALEAARQINEPEQRLTALASVLRTIPAAERSGLDSELMIALKDLPFEYKRARAIGEIADLLSPSQVIAALEMASTLEDAVDQASAFIALLPHLPADRRRSIVVECWQLLKSIDSGYDAASTLSALAPMLPRSAANDIARTAGMIIGSIMDEYDQASAITILAPLLAAQDETAQSGPLPDKYVALEKGLLAALAVKDAAVRTQLLIDAAHLWIDICEDDQCYRLWQNTIQHLAGLPLADTIVALSMLTPVVEHLAGMSVVRQLTQLLSTFATFPVAESR